MQTLTQSGRGSQRIAKISFHRVSPRLCIEDFHALPHPTHFSKNNLPLLPANLALSLWMDKTVNRLKTKCSTQPKMNSHRSINGKGQLGRPKPITANTIANINQTKTL
jgi:hypothetical protein